MPSKNFIFFLCMYKMGEISKGYKKCEVEIIDKGRYFWVNRKDLEVESDVANWAQIFDKCNPEKQKYRQELTPNANINDVGCLCAMIQSKENLKAVENHQKDFQNSKKVRIRP